MHRPLGQADPHDDQRPDDAEHEPDRGHQEVALPGTALCLGDRSDELVVLRVGSTADDGAVLGDRRVLEEPGGKTLGALVLLLAGVQSLDQARKVFWTSLGGLRLVRVLSHPVRLPAVRVRHQPVVDHSAVAVATAEQAAP